MINKIYIAGMMGLGDNIYQRSFIKQLNGDIYLRTPWPEIYKDLCNVFPVKSETILRTQRKNENKTELQFYELANVQHEIRCAYQHQNIFNGMAKCFGFNIKEMDLPDFGKSPVEGEYFVIRPVTVRREWQNESRNPLPEYIEYAAKQIRLNGGIVVSVADLKDGEEWLEGAAPEADITYHKGELSVSQLMALCQNAKAIIGGIGWIVPAAMAMKKPAFVVCGGQGGYNAPHMISSNLVPHKITFSIPDNHCMCKLKDHQCDKRISNYEQHLRHWIAALG